jgi:hypothetical protein
MFHKFFEMAVFSCSNAFLNVIERGLFFGYFWLKRLFSGGFVGWHTCEFVDVGARVLQSVVVNIVVGME